LFSGENLRKGEKMKKLLTVLLSLLVVLTIAGCAKKEEPAPAPEAETPAEETPAETPAEEVKVSTYEEFAALPTDGSAVVTIEAYVQAAQNYDGATASLYLQDKDGAYFVYGAQLSEEDYAKIVESTDMKEGWKGTGNGMKVQVTGTKSEWSGEVELMDATVTVIDDGDKYIAEAADITASLPTDPAASMNQKVAFKDMTVVAANDAGDAFIYNWDGSGVEGDDVYFNVEKDGMTYTFLVESALCHIGSDVYEAARALEVGQTIDMEGFLYWYEGPQPHITSITVK